MKARVTRLKARVGRLKIQVRKLKAQVEAIKLRVERKNSEFKTLNFTSTKHFDFFRFMLTSLLSD